MSPEKARCGVCRAPMHRTLSGEFVCRRAACGNPKTTGRTHGGQFKSNGHPRFTRTHGMSKGPEHLAWLNMKRRCLHADHPQYKDYGGRGIGVFEEWVSSFEKFFEHVGRRPSSAYSLDRYPDNNGNYEPGNVRWATKDQQCRNVRGNRWITFDSRTMILEDWAKELKIKQITLLSRLNKWSVEKSFTTPVKKQATRRDKGVRKKPGVNDAYRRWLRENCKCVVCARPDLQRKWRGEWLLYFEPDFTTIDPCHTTHKGMALKGNDDQCIPLCFFHHAEMDGRLSTKITTKAAFAKKYGLDLENEARSHFALFVLVGKGE